MAIFGGTFDPIHNGHLDIADVVMQAMPTAEIHFIPCKKPLLKESAYATPQQRFEMLTLALQDNNHYIVDTRELKRDTPSYMLETLISLRNETKNMPFALILGQDVFNEFCDWHRWEEILDYTHLIIVPRQGYPASDNVILQQLLKQHQCSNIQCLLNKAAGYIYQLDITPIDISSTVIRKNISLGQNQNAVLPKAIWDYIKKHRLYQ